MHCYCNNWNALLWRIINVYIYLIICIFRLCVYIAPVNSFLSLRSTGSPSSTLSWWSFFWLAWFPWFWWEPWGRITLDTAKRRKWMTWWDGVDSALFSLAHCLSVVPPDWQQYCSRGPPLGRLFPWRKKPALLVYVYFFWEGLSQDFLWNVFYMFPFC